MADARAATMRLDLFLWHVRLTKTRALAQALAEQGMLRIDGRRVDKAHCPVRVGQMLTLAVHGRVRVLRILALPARRGPAPEAHACYEEVAPANVSQKAAVD